MGQFKQNLVALTGGAASFFDEFTATNLFVERLFGDGVRTITVSNDSTSDEIFLSYDGASVDGALKAGESITLNTSYRTGIYIRGTAGGGGVRIWGW